MPNRLNISFSFTKKIQYRFAYVLLDNQKYCKLTVGKKITTKFDEFNQPDLDFFLDINFKGIDYKKDMYLPISNKKSILFRTNCIEYFSKPNMINSKPKTTKKSAGGIKILSNEKLFGNQQTPLERPQMLQNANNEYLLQSRPSTSVNPLELIINEQTSRMFEIQDVQNTDQNFQKEQDEEALKDGSVIMIKNVPNTATIREEDHGEQFRKYPLQSSDDSNLIDDNTLFLNLDDNTVISTIFITSNFKILWKRLIQLMLIFFILCVNNITYVRISYIFWKTVIYKFSFQKTNLVLWRNSEANSMHGKKRFHRLFQFQTTIMGIPCKFKRISFEHYLVK